MTVHVLNRHDIHLMMPPYHCEEKAGCRVETLATIAGGQFGDVLLQLRREQQEQQRSHGIQPKKKSVRFASNVKVYPIRLLDDFSEDEIVKMWYNEQEWNAIKQDCLAITSLVSHETILLIAHAQAIFVVWNLAHLKVSNDERETDLVLLQPYWKSKIYNGMTREMMIQRLLLLHTMYLANPVWMLHAGWDRKMKSKPSLSTCKVLMLRLCVMQAVYHRHFHENSFQLKIDRPPRPPRRSTNKAKGTSKRGDAEIWNPIPNYYTLSEMSYWMIEPESMIQASLTVK
jgi:hypothetical protein